MRVSKAPQEGSVDRRHLRRNLMLTPEERLRRIWHGSDGWSPTAA